MIYQLPPLPYAYDALEPYMTKKTLTVHHDKHHQAYTDGFNKALEAVPEPYKSMAPEQLLKSLDKIPEPARTAVKNFGGGYVNHSFFWPLLKKNGGVLPEGELAKAITASFKSFDQFKVEFSDAAKKLFGSGWTWLVLDPKERSLRIMNLPNQESPLSQGLVPLLTLDVWEHAYYIDYENRRVEFIEKWWNVVNWDMVAEHYKKADKRGK
ncbi:superoxide dismutase [Candidatus Dependentiae bacterium HGW-Dependentiae-1]|nr:MAG: superoxide dismutase [Candidatus Dependentiae bacterium HGW-Dependentiae-1]